MVTENMVHQHSSIQQHLSPQRNPVLQSSHNHNDNPAVEVSPQTVIDEHVSLNSSVDHSQTKDSHSTLIYALERERESLQLEYTIKHGTVTTRVYVVYVTCQLCLPEDSI